MIFDVRRFGLTVIVTCLLATALLVASGGAFAKGPLYEPDYDYRVFPPYQSIGIAEDKELKHVSYQLTDCVWVMTSFDLFGPATQVHKKERTVTVIAPASMDLTNERIINGLIVNGWREAWKNCFSSYVQNDTNYTEFAGVRVLVVQRKERIVQTGRVKVNDEKGIYIDEMNNLAIERKVANLQAQAEADARAKQAEADAIAQAQQLEANRQAAISSAQNWQFLKTVFWLIVGLAFAALLYKYLPPLLTRIRWFFSPHPAVRELRNATRNRNATFVNPNAMADALSFAPANATEAELARKDIAKLKKDVAEKSEVLRAQEELENTVIEMERAKKRVEVLQNRRS